MTSITKTKLVAYLSAIFVAGAVSGGVVGWKKGRNKPAPAASIEKVCRSVEDRLKKSLELTPDQVGMIQPILDQAAHKIKKTHTRCLWEIEQVLVWRSEEIAKHLTSGQITRLEEFDLERRRNKEQTSKDAMGKESKPK